MSDSYADYVEGFPDRTVDSRDANGRYCGMKQDGTAAASPPGMVGYCGPECEHCTRFPYYALQDGVWVCAADYEPGE